MPGQTDDGLSGVGDGQLELSKATVEKKLGRQRPEVFSSTWQEVACAVSVLGSLATADFALGGFQVVLPSLIEPFQIPPESTTWPASALSLVAGACLFPFGRLADMYGGYVVFNIGMIWFCIWTIATGFTHGFIELVMCRAMQGLGIAAFLPAGISLLGRTYPPGPRKNLIFSIYGALAPLGFLSGIMLGGLTQSFLTWRWYFWIAGIISVCFNAVALFTAPRDFTQTRSLGVEMDWLGVITIVPGSTMLIYALTESSQAPHGWQSPDILATLILGLAFIAAAIYVEGWVATSPLVPASIFKVKFMKRMLLLLFIIWGAFSMYLFYANFYIEQIIGMSPFLTGIWFTPWAAAGIFLAAISGLLLHMLPGQVLLIFSSAAKIVAVLLFALMPKHPSYWAWVFPAMLAEALCVDILFTVSNVYLSTSLPKDAQGLAGAMINVTVFFGNAFFLALSDVVLQYLRDRKASQEAQYHGVFWLAVGLAVLGLLLCFFMKLGKAGSQNSKAADVEAKEVNEDEETQSEASSKAPRTKVEGPPGFTTIRVVDSQSRMQLKNQEDDAKTVRSYASASTCTFVAADEKHAYADDGGDARSFMSVSSGATLVPGSLQVSEKPVVRDG